MITKLVRQAAWVAAMLANQPEVGSGEMHGLPACRLRDRDVLDEHAGRAVKLELRNRDQVRGT